MTPTQPCIIQPSPDLFMALYELDDLAMTLTDLAKQTTHAGTVEQLKKLFSQARELIDDMGEDISDEPCHKDDMAFNEQWGK